jgi:uncharacterized protein
VASRLTVGVVSDTHGLLRPEAVEALRGSDVILHAGDIGGRHVLQELGEIAPVIAVRGNVDGGWARLLPERRRLDLGGVPVLILHDRALLGLDPFLTEAEAASGAARPRSRSGVTPAKRAGGPGAAQHRPERIVVFGHSHQPLAERREGVLWFNPGSAGPRRFRLPVSVGRLVIESGRVRHRLLQL